MDTATTTTTQRRSVMQILPTFQSLRPGWEHIAFLAAIGSIVALFWARLLRTPHMVENVEVQVLSLTLWWKDGLFPYLQPTELPVLQNPYGPLYQWLCMKLPWTSAQPYLVGRAISVAAILTTLTLVFAWVQGRTASRRLAALAVLLPLASKPLILFAPLYRVDSLALMFSVLGFFLVTRRPTDIGLVTGAIAFLFAFITKMTFIAAPLATIIFLWLSGRRRGAVLLASLTALALPASVVYLEWLSGGAYLASASFGNLPTAPLKSLELLLRPGLSLFWLAALVVAARAAGFDPEKSPTLLYVLSSLIVAATFGANPLSSWNYLMEFYVALGMLTGEILHRDLRRYGLRPAVSALLTLHAAVTLPMAVGWMYRANEPLTEYRWRYETALARLAPWKETGTRVVVLDSVAGRDALNALAAPNAVAAPPSIEDTPLVAGAVDRALGRGEVELVLRGDDWIRAERTLARSAGSRARPFP